MKHLLLGGILLSISSMSIFALDSGLAPAPTPSKEARVLTLSSDAGGTNYCGDGITRNGEQCDDGNYLDGDGCDNNCKIEIQSMAINEKGLPGNSCPKGCRWNRWVGACRCAAGVERTLPTGGGETTQESIIRESPTKLRESPSKPTKRITILIEDIDPSEGITTPRDPATGQSSGKRTSSSGGVGPDMQPDLEMYTGPCKPPYLCETIDIVSNVSSPRDSASGQASGKRQHGSVKIVKERGKSTPMLYRIQQSNQPTGGTDTGLQNFVFPILPAWTGRLEEIPVDDDITMGARKGGFFDIFVEQDAVSPRDSASGQATGKRQHKPYRIVTEPGDCDDEGFCESPYYVIQADLDGDGLFESSISLNGLPPGQPLRLKVWQLMQGQSSTQ